MVNKVTLIGNLGRDPEIRRFESGAVVAKFSVATNENVKDKNGEWQTQTEWHEIVTWYENAERAERQLKKGSTVYLEGKITHRKYTDANGVERNITEIVANTFRSLDKREPGSAPRETSFPTEEQAARPAPPARANIPMEVTNVPDSGSDDLPF